MYSRDSIRSQGSGASLLSYFLCIGIGVIFGLAWGDWLFEKDADRRVAAEQGICKIQMTQVRKEAEAIRDDASDRLRFFNTHQLPLLQEQDRKANEAGCRAAIAQQMSQDRALCVLNWRNFKPAARITSQDIVIGSGGEGKH
jgi:hypothetical protein